MKKFKYLIVFIIFFLLMFSKSWAQNIPTIELLLYHSASTQKFYASVGANKQLLLQPWRDYAKQHQIKIQEINDARQIKFNSNQVLVLPSSVALSEQEKNEILKYQRAGGAVLATWATGSRDASGEWMGWSFLQQLAGVEVVRELPADGSENYLITRGEGPLTHTLTAGQRIWLGKTTERPFVMRGTTVAAWASNWIRQIETKQLTEGLVLHSERNETTPHRVAVFGFSETGWEYQLSDVHQLITGTLKWLVRTPSLLKANWPKAYTASYMVGMDTEEKFQNSTYLIDQFVKFDYKGSFYLLTSEAKKYPDIIQKLEKEGFDLNYHGDVHDSFNNQSKDLQQQRIGRMIQQLSSVMRNPKVGHGFRAPTEGFDADIPQLLYQAGIRHHLADPNQGNGRLPFFARIPEQRQDDRFVIFPRTTRDDFNLRQYAGDDANRLAQAMIDDFESARAQGAFGVLSIHSHLVFAESALGQAFPVFLQHAKNQTSSVWLASGQAIARWWNERERLKIERFTDSELQFSVSGSNIFENGAFILILKEKNKLPTFKSTNNQTPPPLLSRLDEYRVLLMPGALQAGQYGYRIIY